MMFQKLLRTSAFAIAAVAVCFMTAQEANAQYGFGGRGVSVVIGNGFSGGGFNRGFGGSGFSRGGFNSYGVGTSNFGRGFGSSYGHSVYRPSYNCGAGRSVGYGRSYRRW